MTNDEKNTAGLIQIKKREDVCPSKKLDLDDVRERIDRATAHDAAEKTGPEYWRSLEELAGTDAFKDALHREFPKGASEWVDSVSRRGFLKVMGASLGLAGMTGCVRLPLEPIVPYVRQPEGVIPGRPMYYATASHARRIREPGARRKPSRPPHENRRQRSASRLARWHRHLHAGLHPWPLRSRPLPDRHVDGRRPLVAVIPRRDPRPAQRAESRAGRRHPHPDADHFFSHARRPAAQFPEDLSAGQVARLRAH